MQIVLDRTALRPHSLVPDTLPAVRHHKPHKQTRRLRVRRPAENPNRIRRDRRLAQRRVVEHRPAPHMALLPLRLRLPIEVDAHARSDLPVRDVHGHLARRERQVGRVAANLLDEHHGVLPGLVQRLALRHRPRAHLRLAPRVAVLHPALDHHLEALVDGAALGRVGRADLTEQTRIRQVAPRLQRIVALRELEPQRPQPVDILADAERREARPVVAVIWVIPDLAPHRLQYLRPLTKQLTMQRRLRLPLPGRIERLAASLVQTAVQPALRVAPVQLAVRIAQPRRRQRALLRLAVQVILAAAKEQVDADADVRGQERLTGLPARHAGLQLPVHERGLHLVAPRAPQLPSPVVLEAGHKRAVHIAHRVPRPAGRTPVNAQTTPRHLRVVLPERLLVLVAYRLVVRRHNHQLIRRHIDSLRLLPQHQRQRNQRHQRQQ